MPLSNQASKRFSGSASKLEGSCCIVNIFINDTESFWSHEETDKALEKMDSAVAFILDNAKKYSIELEISQVSMGIESEIRYPGIIPIDMFAHPDWTEYIFILTGHACGNSLVRQIKKKLKVKHVVSAFHINKPGRSYNLTYSLGVDPVFFAERDILFSCYENGMPTYAATFAHEILHSFGAGELYFPFDETNERFSLSREYFPNDVMLRVDESVNELSIGDYTAFRVGWLKKLDKKYRVFEDCC